MKYYILSICFTLLTICTQAQTVMHPDSAYAVVNVSVCNMQGAGKFTASMTSQALLGMPVKVLHYNGWYKIETPDGYTGWVHRMVIQPMSKEKLRHWNQQEKVVVTAHYGFAYQQPDEHAYPVSDIVAGNRFVLKKCGRHFYEVEYPDGRIAFISKKLAQPESVWRKSIQTNAKALLNTAYSLLGVPYLWGGTSSKGVDCSGLVRTILFMHDIIMPRDAWQQALIGQRIAISKGNYHNLKQGDLVFFGKKASATRKESISHVGIYMGNQRFIHAMGDVHISSFNAHDKLYDQFNTDRVLFAVRFIPHLYQIKEITTTTTNPLYQ